MKGNTRTILLVEDQAMIAMAEKRRLEQGGYSVRHVLTGEEAVRVVVEGAAPVDLVLMDINLGDGIDGADAARRILAHTEIPVVFLSSHTEPEVVEKTEKITSYGYVVKNSGITVLDASIKMALKLFDARVERGRAEDRLQDAQATMTAIVENSNDNIWSINANYEITYVNHVFVEAYKAAFGVELKNGSRVLEGLPEAILPVWKERYTRVLNGERFVVVDSVSLHGLETHVEVAMNPIVHGERIIGASMTGRDISERVREDERIRASERRAAAQRSALAKLALDQVFAGENMTRALQRVVEVIADALSVARTSVWVLSEDGARLQCLALYQADTGTHSEGPFLKAADLPRYFNAIISDNRIYAEDAQNDPRTSELTESYLKPLRITSMLDAGVFREGRMVGVVCSEHVGPKRRWQPDEESFISTAAAITAQIFIKIERNKAEEALKKSESKYRGLSTLLRLLADTMPDMLWAKNLDKKYLFVNKAICMNLLNASDTEEPLGKTDMFFAVRERESHPENPEWHTFGEVCRDSDAITLEEMRPMQFEEFGNVKGKNLVLEVHKAPFFDEEGKLIGVVGSARDVTAAKEAETQLRKLSRAVEQSPASVVITDLDGAIEYANPKFTEITGYTLEEAKGQNPRVLKSGEQGPEYYKELWQTISSGRTWRGEFHNKKKNGELFWEAASISPLLTSEGITTSFIAVKEDITERKRSEEALARQLAEKETLLREVHHRVKNNISSIKGLLSLQAGEAESAETRAALEDALARVQSMGELYDRLLLTGEYREVGMKDYLEGLVGSILESFPESAKPALDIRIDDFAMSPKNAASVGIILNELVTNALKYAFKDRGRGALSISLDRDGSSAALTVKDDGVGLPADFRLPDGADPSARTGAGHGFGLTLVQMLAEQLGGEFTAESGDSGKGAGFSLRFPLAKGVAEGS